MDGLGGVGWGGVSGWVGGAAVQVQSSGADAVRMELSS